MSLFNYLHEVEHVAQRILHLEAAIDEAVREASVELRAVIEALCAFAKSTGGVYVVLPSPAKCNRLPVAAAQVAGLERRSEGDRLEAQHCLNKRYKTLAAKGKNKNQIVTAVARELLGFIWAIATHTEQQHKLQAS